MLHGIRRSYFARYSIYSWTVLVRYMQKECNKRATVALEDMAAFEPFSPTKSAHFDGRAVVCCLVKCHNPRIAMLFAMKMWHICRIAARLAKSTAIPYPSASRPNHKSAARF